MKTLLIIAIALFSFTANAQSQQDSTTRAINLRMNAAGATMQKGSAQMIAGYLITMVGAGIAAYGSGIDHEPLMVIGCFTSVIGVGLTFSGFSKIGKAGKQLQYINK